MEHAEQIREKVLEEKIQTALEMGDKEDKQKAKEIHAPGANFKQ